MSIETWQFPRQAMKRDLTLLLRQLGYVIGTNLLQPGPAGTVSLFWSERKDFKSTSGVDASIFPLDSNGKKIWKTSTDWGLRTRTSVWATSFDQDFQNQTVRLVRKRFGGSFYNDHFGNNRYTVIQRRKSIPASRGIHGVLEKLLAELDSLEYALPPKRDFKLHTPKGTITEEEDTTGVLRFSKRFEPDRVLYNALVPFLIATIEHFFREAFEILLMNDSVALRKLDNQNRKVSFAEASAISRGELTIQRVASNWYSFQNIDSIQKAFHEVLNIDIWKLLRRRKKVGSRFPILHEALNGLIEARHGIIHHFSINRDLDRQGFLDRLRLTRSLVQSAAKEIAIKLGVPLGPG